MAYDEKCFDLAQYFSTDPQLSEKQVGELAQHIQTSIEDWMSMNTEVEP